MADYKLYYFNFWGRGEVARLMLAASGCDWEDIRFSKDDNWSSEYKHLAPYGQAPFLCYKGKFFSQSVAICSFLARELGFAGTSSLETLQIDEVMHLVQEIMDKLVFICYENDATKKAELTKELLETDVPKFCGFVQKKLKDNNNCGHFVGNTLSLADLAVYDIITNTQAWFKVDFETPYPSLKLLRGRVESNENIKKYLAKHLYKLG
ncbi:hypothetical protein ACOMHN_020516 [Nucella lapillus]